MICVVDPRSYLRTWAQSIGFGLSLVILGASLASAQNTLVPNAVQQFFGPTGAPLSAGSVYFYIPQTTTPKTVWSDPGSTLPYSNPIQLNSAGEPPSGAGIWGTGSYRQQVFDSNGNLVWDATTTTSISTPTGTSGDGMPVGFIMPFGGSMAPSGYDFAYGQQYSRASFSLLLSAITISQNATCTNGSPNIGGLGDTSQFGIGQPIESPCLPPGTTISSISSATAIVVSANATGVTGATTIQVFPYGNGNGSTTFNLPDLRGYTLAGRDNMGGTPAGVLNTLSRANGWDLLGAAGGSSANILTIAQMPAHTHTITDPGHAHNLLAATGPGTTLSGGPTFNYVSTSTSSSTTGITINSTGGGSQFSIVQPTITINYIIKVQNNLGAFTIPIGNNTVLGNNSGSTAPPTAITAPSVLAMICNTSGAILVNVSSTWQCLAPGSGGQVLTIGGSGVPAWAAGGGGGGGPWNIAGSTINPGTYKVDLAASNSSQAGLNFGVGTAPSVPANGDMWVTSAGAFLQIAGTTQQISFGGVTSFNGRVGVVVPTTSDYSFGQIAGSVALTQLAAVTSNVVLGSISGGTPIVIGMPSCSGSNQFIQWVSGSGPQCGTATGGGGGGSPGGSNGQLQVNVAGAFGGMPNMSGDGTLNTTSGALTLTTVNSNVGTFGAAGTVNVTASTFPIITVNAKGLITAVTTATPIADASQLTNTTLASNVIASSLTSIGQLSSYGGSGPANGQLLIGATSGCANSATNCLVLATLTAGTGISVTNSSGGILLANSGVTSIGGLTGSITCGANLTCSGGTISASGGGSSSVVNGYMYGCGLSNDNSTPTTKVDVTACYAADSTNTVMMSGNSNIVDFATVGANGLDQGSIGASSAYALFEIENSSGPTVAAIATLETAGSFPSPTLPSGYTYKRYIGTVRTNGSSQIIAFTQQGNSFIYNAVVGADLSVGAPATAQTLLPLTVPLGFAVFPILQIKLDALASRHTVNFWPPTALSSQGIIIDSQNTSESYTQIHTIWTDSSGRLSYQDTTTVALGNTAGVVRNLTVQTLGWIDPQILGGGGSGGGGSGGGGSGTVQTAAANLCGYYPGPGTTNVVGGDTACSLNGAAMTLGTAGSLVGQLKLAGNSSQIVTLQAQATAGNVTVNMPSIAGTLADVATSPLSISAAGNISLGIVPLNIGGTNANLTASAGAIVYSTASAFALTSIGSAGQYLSSNGTSAPSWTNISTSLTAGTCGINLTGTTNVTIGISAPITVPCGGTGATTLTANAPLFGNGTSALVAGTRTGNTTTVVTGAGSYTQGHCLVADANSNAIDCGGVPVYNTQANYFYGIAYGMNCNGSANNVPAYNALMSAATANGGIAVLPAGTCVFASTPSNAVVPSGGLRVIGAGEDVTNLQFTGGTNGLVFDDTGNTGPTYGALTLADFSVITTQVSPGNGIQINGTGIPNFGPDLARTIIERIHTRGDLANGTHYWTNGLNLNCASYIYVRHYDHNGSLGSGAGIVGGNNTCPTLNTVGFTIDTPTIIGTNFAIDIEGYSTNSGCSGSPPCGTAQGVVVNNAVLVATNVCIRVSGNNGAGTFGTQVSLINNWCDTQNTGFQILNWDTILVQNNGFVVGTSGSPPIGINCSPCQFGTISGNAIGPNAGGTTTQDYIVLGSSASNIIAIGNNFLDGANGIIMQSGSSNNKAFGNRCGGTIICLTDSGTSNQTCQSGSTTTQCIAAITND